MNFLRTSILFLMLYLIYTQEISVGQFFSLFIYSFFIFGPLQEIGNVINIYREAEVSLDNMRGILDTPIEKKPEHPTPIGALERLSFENVSFTHQTASMKALDGITFSVGRGDTIAFVGPSGSGKSTLVKLLVGLYRPAEGRILYNRVPGDAIDLDHLREHIGFVTQDTQLFSGTIRENLLFVNPNATDEQCLKVLEQAACHTLLARAANGLDSVIGEGGVKVSGGEKQRLSIARALLRKPDLLVFDEATSALDSLTEEEITETIRDVSMRGSQITILIAHRLSTIMHADTIYVLEHGKVAESGRHEDLLEMKGLYYAMWRQQIGERRILAAALWFNYVCCWGVGGTRGRHPAAHSASRDRTHRAAGRNRLTRCRGHSMPCPRRALPHVRQHLRDWAVRGIGIAVVEAREDERVHFRRRAHHARAAGDELDEDLPLADSITCVGSTADASQRHEPTAQAKGLRRLRPAPMDLIAFRLPTVSSLVVQTSDFCPYGSPQEITGRSEWSLIAGWTGA